MTLPIACRVTDLMHQLLLGHLLGALDDDEHDRVDALLEHDEECCRQLLLWRRRLAPLEAMRPEIEPPPGLAARTCRCIAACIPALDESRGWNRGLSSHPVSPCRGSHLRWLDVAAVALFLTVTVSMILPAIDDSRFQARLVSCQDRLRQFGLALGLYADQQQHTLGQMACDGRLTRAGVFAAGCIQDGGFADNLRPLCPDAWLAAQGVLWTNKPPNIPKQPGPVVLGNSTLLTTISPCPRDLFSNDPYSDWPGTWRNGTTDGRRGPCTPAERPLLADAPSANLPGQGFFMSMSHRGRGRNVVFKDGRVDFLPSTANRGTTSWLLTSTQPMTGGASVPVVFVKGR